MKVMFCGDLSQNNGPANVNKSLYKYCSFLFIDTKGKNKLKIFSKFIKNLFNSKVIIFSCNYRINYILFKIAKIFKKQTIYLMHGYAGFEVIINKTKNAKKIVNRENYVFRNVDLILTVSENYMNWFLSKRREFNDKTYFLTNGIDFNVYKNIKKDNIIRDNNSIAVCGANRAIKHNGIIAKTVNELNEINYNCKLFVYGYIYPDGDIITENENVKIKGRIPQNELFVHLQKTKLFVVNSIQESFGLSIIDALMCGCDILVSKNSGIVSILNIEENDIINNIDDENEIKNKIMYNLEHSNNERLLKSIDFEHYSCKNSAKRLEKIVDCIITGNDYFLIK